MARSNGRDERLGRDLYDDSPVEHVPTAHERRREPAAGPRRTRDRQPYDGPLAVDARADADTPVPETASGGAGREAARARLEARQRGAGHKARRQGAAAGSPAAGGSSTPGDFAPHGGIKGIPYIPTPRTDDADVARWHHWAVVAFGVLMALFTVVGLLLFARPSVSELEKRALTEYPAYTPESFADGSALTQLALWYSDTYPLREALVQADQALQGLYGVQPSVQMVGGNVQADELPPADDAQEGAKPAYDPSQPVEAPGEEEMDAAIQSAITNGIYVQDGAAYNIYYFAQEAVDRYAQALNTCADNLDGQAKVYSILVPNNSGAKLDEETLRELGGTDQEQAIRYFYSRYNDKVEGVWIWDALRAHRDEYTYFRTDHHWTQLGAYYAYVELCKAKGIEPADVLGWEERDYGPFRGSYYAELGNDDALTPDTVQTWTPASTNDMTIWDEDGQETEAKVITDVTGWAENGLYNTFIEGDQALERIDNPKLDDGSSCLVVKDSFGCCFVPCLVDSYQTTWVIDFRYSDKSIPQFVREQGIKDVIFLNNMSMAGTDPVSQALLSQVQNDAPAKSADAEETGSDTGEDAEAYEDEETPADGE